MRSAPSAEAWRDPRGASTADRLVVTACRLVAEHGEDATSLRAVAQAAGCSPSLVVHHFGSRAGLLEACDRAVVALLDEALAPLLNGADPGTSSVESVAGALLAAADDDPVLAYALRSLTEGGRAGHHLFVALFEHARRLED
ncbi:MAG: TetR/AcrR family transcriptional regulator, partial [Actinomyces sp.]